jgi:hypothetical protein
MAEQEWRECNNCGKPFAVKQTTGRPRMYCSERCKKQAWKIMKEGHDPLPERTGPNGLGNCIVCKDKQAVIKVGKFEFCQACIE